MYISPLFSSYEVMVRTMCLPFVDLLRTRTSSLFQALQVPANHFALEGTPGTGKGCNSGMPVGLRGPVRLKGPVLEPSSCDFIWRFEYSPIVCLQDFCPDSGPISKKKELQPQESPPGWNGQEG